LKDVWYVQALVHALPHAALIPSGIYCDAMATCNSRILPAPTRFIRYATHPI